MLEVRHAAKRYGRQQVLSDVSLTIGAGESVALVGESGSGKSTLSRLILGLEKPTGGSVCWNGRAVRSIPRKERYRAIQPVFQDNVSCFNPRRTIQESLGEPMKYILGLDKTERANRARRLMEQVELPAGMLERYPHQLSGGQQKRICIARALSIRPQLIVLDEAVAGLDMAVMIKILDLLKNLQAKYGSAYLFITHDIRAAQYLSARQVVIEPVNSGRL